MAVKIASFLPKYKAIDKGIAESIGLYTNESLNKSICSKEEFKELSSGEPQKTKIFNHQQIIARLMTSHTPYNELLLYHEMGSGKTCSAISAIEKSKTEQYGIRRALILAKGEGLLESFKKELTSSTCTDGQYIPENYKTLNADTRTRRVNKMLGKFYDFNTFEVFAKSIKRKTVREINTQYSNFFIVMDEIHNIRIQSSSNEKERKMYNQFHRFLHAVSGCKILLLSGTPMKDNVGEIGAIMNLILPMNMQIRGAQDEDFQNMNEADRNDRIMYLANNRELGEYFQGRVSFMQTPVENVNVVKVFEGTLLPIKTEYVDVLRAQNAESTSGPEPFRVIELNMSPYQTHEYLKVYNNDSRKNYYINSRLASLFTWNKGPVLLSKSISKGMLASMRGGSKSGLKQKTVYTLNPDLVKDITTKGVLDLNKLAIYSSVYAASINVINNAKKDRQLTFVYCEFKHKSGLFLFESLLKLNGYASANRNALASPAKRMVLFEGAMSSANRKLLDIFNSPENRYGDYISVILGTRVVMEGYSFKNIQNEIILTPFWNYSETAQAIARGYRAHSHTDLEPSPENKINVRIYQFASIPTDAGKDMRSSSIDMRLYTLSFKKDVNIKRVERLIKENAVDCQLLYRVNSQGEDGSRECEYMQCAYSCSGTRERGMVSCGPTDYSTFNLFYNKGIVQTLVSKIQELLNSSDRLSMDFKTLKSRLIGNSSDLTDFTLISALNILIQNRVPFIDRYGFKAYLDESFNNFYLTTFMSSNDKTDIYYTKNPSLVIKNSFKYILISKKNNMLRLGTIVDIDSEGELLKSIVFRMSPVFQERILEKLIDFVQRTPEKINRKLEFILDLFKGMYSIDTDNATATSWLLENSNILRCKDRNMEWHNCTPENIKSLSDNRRVEMAEFVNRARPYGYYGTINPLTRDFCLVNVAKAGIAKGHAKSVGMRCNSYRNLEEIYKSIYGEDPASRDRSYLCRSIKNFLEDKKLIRFDTTCGTSKKVRVKQVKAAAVLPPRPGKGKGKGRKGKK